MKNVDQWKQWISGGALDAALCSLYTAEAVPAQRQRLLRALDTFAERFGGDRPVRLFSAPGRTELGGNHTDHSGGRVLAAGVTLDVIGVAACSGEKLIRVESEGFPTDEVSLDDLSVQPGDVGRSSALIRGIAEQFTLCGLRLGGIDAVTTSDVPKGSGLSSSAAFEILIGWMFSELYNEGTVAAAEIARMAQYAENVHFGKPCGQMDQLASAAGGIVAMDFVDPERPMLRSIGFDFNGSGVRLCIVDTGGSHADLTPEYAAVPAEMEAVSKALGVSSLRKITEATLIAALPVLRRSCGDRAVLRALHFIGENERVDRQTKTLERGDLPAFLRLVVESGHSSFEYLQNVYSAASPSEQGVSLGLCLAQRLLNENGGWRVHGGGFAGTIQCFVPEERLSVFRESMERVFGRGSCHVLSIRRYGGVCLDRLPGFPPEESRDEERRNPVWRNCADIH